MTFALVQDTTTGDVFAVDETNQRMTESLYCGDWQTDDQLDPVKVEATPWQFDYPTDGRDDTDIAFNLFDQPLRYLHQWEQS